MATYKVWVSFSGCACYDVVADSEDEARDNALEIADPYDCEQWDFDTDIE